MPSEEFDETLPTAPPRPGGEIPKDLECFGGYRVIRVLGRGGMGVVYEAEQLSLKRRVALKMLHSIMDRELLLRFLAEAELSAALHHSNIVHIYEINQHDGTPYFGMEYVDGGTLAQRLEAGPLPPREAAALLIPIARAVHFAHTKNVVHRDLKPGNILLDQQGVPKVADFGIAKRLDDESMLTLTGSVMGTPCYMAPEQASGASEEASPAADIYSLGVILYEMLVGQPPFLPKVGEKPVGWRVVNEDPIPITKIRRELSRELEAICLLCLRKSMRERYATAEDLADDLQRYLDGAPVKAKPPSIYRRTIWWMRRHPLAAVGRAAAILAVGAGLPLWGQHWLLYEHPHIEYSADIEVRRGGVDAVRPLTPAQAAHAGICLRLTRAGLWGHVTRIEAVNSRGYPATARDLLQYEVLGNLLQANAGFTDPNAKGKEVVRVDVTYSNGRPAVLTTWDRNHQKILSVELHSDGEGAVATHSLRLRFVDERSFDFTTRSGASEADMELDDNGRNIAMRFYDSLGGRARNGDGLYGYKIKRGAHGQVTELTNLDENDRPMPNHDGVYQIRADWNSMGDPVRMSFYDAEGHPMAAMNGVASVGVTYDESRNRSSMRRYDLQGNLKDAPGGFLNTYFGWAILDYQRDEYGQLKGFTAHPAGDQSPPLIVDHAALKYDEHGYVSEYITWGTDSKEVTRLTEHFDEVGNPLEYHQEYPSSKASEWKRYRYDERGNAIQEEDLSAAGVVEGRTKVEYLGQRPTREMHYDAEGKLHRIGSGYSQMDCRYNEKKYLVEKRYTGYELPDSAAKTLIQSFDELGRMDREAWLDADGRLTNGPFHWAEHLRGYHEDGLLLSFNKFTDAEKKLVRGPPGYAEARFEFDAKGVCVGAVEEGMDVAKLGYATRHQSYDAATRVIDERFFDASGAKAWCRAGYHHRVVHAFSPSDMATKTTYEDFDPKSYPYFRMREEEAWEGKRPLHSRETFEDKDGKPVHGQEPCLAVEKRYDTQGREVLRIRSGCSLEDWGAPVWQMETEWGGNGVIRKITEQAFDDAGKPLAVGNAKYGACEITLGDEHGKRKHRTTTGLPEKELGYSRREVDYAPGGAISAIHYFYSNDEPAPVEVVIATIDADAQPSSKNFQPGDILVSRNGEPVTSLRGMGAGKPFPGGWVEVCREGRTIRIDGFQPGMMGVNLKERVVPRPEAQ